MPRPAALGVTVGAAGLAVVVAPLALVLTLIGAITAVLTATSTGGPAGLDPAKIPPLARQLLPRITNLTALHCPELPVAWVVAEIAAESGWNPTAFSRDRNGGTAGLYQLNQANWVTAGGHPWTSVPPPAGADIFDPGRHLDLAIPFVCANLRTATAHLRATGKTAAPLDAMLVCHIAGCARVTGIGHRHPHRRRSRLRHPLRRPHRRLPRHRPPPPRRIRPRRERGRPRAGRRRVACPPRPRSPAPTAAAPNPTRPAAAASPPPPATPSTRPSPPSAHPAPARPYAGLSAGTRTRRTRAATTASAGPATCSPPPPAASPPAPTSTTAGASPHGCAPTPANSTSTTSSGKAGIWNPDTGDQNGWGAPYTGGGIYNPTDPTGGHYDHIHLSVR